MIAHMLNIAVGLTFSGGLIDLFLFGILPGNEKTSWLLIIPVGIVYFFLYYFIFKFLIRKFNFKTPGREEDDVSTKLFTKADVRSAKIVKGLGGKENIRTVDCCATRLRCVLADESLVNESLLKSTGATGVIQKGNNIKLI